MRKILFILIGVYVFAHPLNLTKMDFNLSSKIFHLRFVSYNIEKVFSKEFENEKEISDFKKEIANYTKKHLIIKGCKLKLIDFKVNNEIVIDEYFYLKCKNYDFLKIRFDMFFKEDNTQTGVLKVLDGNKEYIMNFNPQNRIKILEMDEKTSFNDFVLLGILHIIHGFDHITFLLTLLLPAIMFSLSFKDSLKSILIIATAFSISHSVSLMASAFNIVEINPNFIEILIALTIFLTALNNIYHAVNYKKEWLIAFLFGFVHGFAFSEAVRDIHIDFNNFIKIVLGFNLGVEIGQIIIILSIGPILYYLIKKENKIYNLLNFVAIILSVLWFFDRVFGFQFISF
ncbi:HupE/UreJ family protein [Nautilia lithotrophica]